MTPYLVRRFLLGIPTVVGVSLIIFFILRIIPGDPAYVILGADEGAVDPGKLAEVRKQIGTDQPLYRQYVVWVKGVVTLDAGASLMTQRPVSDELRRRVPVSLQLGAVALLIAVSISFPLGIVAAVRQDTIMDYVLRSSAVMGLATPIFFTATLLLLFLITVFGWSPPVLFTPLRENPLENLKQVIWPAVILGLFMAASQVRMIRSSMLEVLRQDYVRTARAKGLASSKVLLRHALKNAMLPVVTFIGLELASLISGSVIIESIFGLPGVGSYLVAGIHNRDFPVVQAVIVMVAVVIILINMSVDMLYGWLDPKVGAP